MKSEVEWGCHVNGMMDFLRMTARMAKSWGTDEGFVELWDRFRVGRDQHVMQVPPADRGANERPGSAPGGG